MDAVEAAGRYRLEPVEHLDPERIYERRWAKQVKMVPPDLASVPAGFDVPGVWNDVLFAIRVHRLADANQTVFVSARNEERFELFCLVGWLWNEVDRRFRVGHRSKRAEPRGIFQVAQLDAECLRHPSICTPGLQPFVRNR